MARNRDFEDEFNGVDDEGTQDAYDQEAPYDAQGDATDGAVYDGAYDETVEPDYGEYDEYGDEDAYDDEEYDDYDEDEAENAPVGGGFLSTLWGKILVGIIGLLVVAVIVLLIWRFAGVKRDTMEFTDDPLPLPAQTAEATQAPGSVVFAPVDEATQAPTDAPATTTPVPTPTSTPAPTDTPEPTATPLPIILSNTPTPSPTPTATPTPSPSPTPTPSPKPTATPRVDLATAETNREAKLRESASASAKVKKTVKKGEALTIHEAALDKQGKIWYFVSVDDQDTQGWMRDYVMDVEGDVAVPTPTPKATATPKADAPADDKKTPAPEAEETVGLGTGKTSKDANVRKIMNGKVVTQLRKGKAVIILDAKLDKDGDLWYEIQVKDSTTRGFVRDYLIKLDKGVEIAKPTPTPKAGESAGSDAATPDDILDREVVGKAKTNRAANVRKAPDGSAKVVVQLKKNTALLILDAYTDGKNSWYEVATADGATYGFVRDYVIDVSEIQKGLEEKKYQEPGAESEQAAE